ncbi:MAG: urea transporter, partial [Elusimicrobia bacterium]|nr:urea transporter [Elusimicrobiota bacterium]
MNVRKEIEADFFVESTLHSYSQILFSDSKRTGLIALAASFADVHAGLSGLLSCWIVNFFSRRLGADDAEVRAGLYGLNGVLLGLAITHYSSSRTPELLILILLFSLLQVLAISFSSRIFRKHALPFLSLPFVLLAWLLILSGTHLVHNGYNLVPTPSLDNFLDQFFQSMGLILFSSEPLAGVLAFLGIILYSRIMAGLAFVSFLICFLFSALFPEYITFMGNNGFNIILTALALGGTYFIPNWWSLLMALIASLLTMILGQMLQSVLSPYHIPVLAAPFNLATLFMLFSLKRSGVSGSLHPVTHFKTPEENFRLFVRENENRAQADHGFMLPFMGKWFVSQGTDGAHTHQGIYRWGLD